MKKSTARHIRSATITGVVVFMVIVTFLVVAYGTPTTEVVGQSIVQAEAE